MFLDYGLIYDRLLPRDGFLSYDRIPSCCHTTDFRHMTEFWIHGQILPLLAVRRMLIIPSDSSTFGMHWAAKMHLCLLCLLCHFSVIWAEFPSYDNKFPSYDRIMLFFSVIWQNLGFNRFICSVIWQKFDWFLHDHFPSYDRNFISKQYNGFLI